MSLACRPSPHAVTRRLAGLGLAMLVLASCGGGGGGGSAGPNPNAPVITDFQITALDPERAGRPIRYVATMTVTDPQADVFQGSCEVTTNVGNLSIPINTVAPGGDPNATVTPVFCAVQITAPAPIQVTGSLAIRDRAGNLSNSVSFVLNISELSRDGSIPEPSTSAIAPEAGGVGRR